MDFPFRLADLFPSDISIVGSDLIPVQCPGLQKIGAQQVRDSVTAIMDQMGKASAVAQQLHSIITNAEKLRQSTDQRVYCMVDFSANQVIGLLKIGNKKLFVYDGQGSQHEMTPLCVLDFYIHESRQRQGCGKHLFEHFLNDYSVSAVHLAIDRPSDKFLYFLKKYYGLEKFIPQVNNFVVFNGFFEQRSDYAGKKPRWSGLDQPAEWTGRKLAGRSVLEDSSQYNAQPQLHLRNGQSQIPNFTARRHDSSIGDVLHPKPFHANGNGHYDSNMAFDTGTHSIGWQYQWQWESEFAPLFTRFRPNLKFRHHRLW